MKIEIFTFENRLSDHCTGSTCFEASPSIKKDIQSYKSIQGVVIIDNIAVKFSFSPMGMDGDIFSTNNAHRTIVKNIVPLYVSDYHKNVLAF